MREFWDQRYSEHDTVYGVAPNLFFKKFIDSHTPGSILLPADGEGRNGLYAAAKGWNVTAFDFSRVARDKALANAKAANLTLQYDMLSIEDFVPADLYDAVGLIYVHLPPDLRSLFHRRIAASLKPGGLLVVEAYNKNQLKYSSGGPKDPAQLFSLEILQKDFAELACIHCEETEEELQEGPFHVGKAALVRYIARKS